MKKGQFKQNGVHLEEHEYNTVKHLLNCGYDIELIPPSDIKGVRSPDVMINGNAWEMKAPQGNGKNTIRNNIKNAGHQSSNIVVDLRRCKLDDEIAVKELYMHFKASKRIRRLIIMVNDEKIIDCKK